MTGHQKEARAARRRHLMARLAAERSELLAGLLGLDERALTETPVLDSWTVKDLLAHIAGWDRWEHRQMKRMRDGEPVDLTVVEDMDAFNAAVVAEWRDRSLAQVLAELREARAAWVAWLEALPEDEFFKSRPFHDWDWAFPNCLEVQWQHDAEHAAQIAAWRTEQGLESDVGPKDLLLATLEAAREELLTASALIRSDERATRLVCGEWTLKDVAGHVADWEWVGVRGLRDMAAGRPPGVEQIVDIDAWNQRHAEARRDQPWEDVWADFRAAREALLEILEGMAQADLARSFPFPWGPRGTAYQWVSVFVAHDREHAQGLREAMGAEGE